MLKWQMKVQGFATVKNCSNPVATTTPHPQKKLKSVVIDETIWYIHLKKYNLRDTLIPCRALSCVDYGQ